MHRRFIIIGVVILSYTSLLLISWILGGRAQQKHSRFWSGTLSSSVQMEEKPPDINRYWLEKINSLRIQKNLRPLKTDSHLIGTAEIWAKEMQMRGEISHTRLDGKTMHQWIDEKQLPFTERGTADGWKSNYFVENIARYYAEPTEAGLTIALDKILNEFLSEGPGGDHYESIYHPDWNSIGVGHAYQPAEDGVARVYFVFHYGSLKQ